MLGVGTTIHCNFNMNMITGIRGSVHVNINIRIVMFVPALP